jgi:hypothetical protein
MRKPKSAQSWFGVTIEDFGVWAQKKGASMKK